MKISSTTLQQEGLTFIELMVSVAILVVVVSIIYSTYFASSSTIEYASQKAQVIDSARIAIDKIARDISCAFARKTYPFSFFKGEHNTNGDMPDDSLDFTALIAESWNVTENRSNLREIGYGLGEDKSDMEGTLLLRREDGIVDIEQDSGGVVQILGEHAKGLEFTFFDAGGQEFDEWDWDKGKKLPVAVKLKLIFTDGKQDFEFETRIDIPIEE